MRERNVGEVLGKFNLPKKTLGGPQFHTDVMHRAGWRIQRNHLTDMFRLLDAKNSRRASGSEDECRRAMEDATIEHALQPYAGPLVILLHGLGRATWSMNPLARHLRAAGYSVLNFQYASGRTDIDSHAQSLGSVIRRLGDSVTHISFVGHSMGNIVVRRYLSQTRSSPSDRETDPRLHRMVMLGPPNQGSRLARFFGGTIPFQMITGMSGSQLGRQWGDFSVNLATPRFEFGIIAGGHGLGKKISNVLLNGPDDLIVSVDETKLVGAHDFIVRPFLHTTIMKHPAALELTARFLRDGYFISEQDRTPLTQ